MLSYLIGLFLDHIDTNQCYFYDKIYLFILFLIQFNRLITLTFFSSIIIYQFLSLSLSLCAVKFVLQKVSMFCRVMISFCFCIGYAGEFDDILDRSNSKSLSDTLEDIEITYKDIRSSTTLESNGSTPPEKYETLLEIENLILKTPSESTLIRDLSLSIKEKDNLLVRRPQCPTHV